MKKSQHLRREARTGVFFLASFLITIFYSLAGGGKFIGITLLGK